MRAQRLMTAPVTTCHPDDSLEHAAHLMWEHDYGAIPVVSKEGNLVGMITDRDVAMSAYSRGRPLHAIPVSTAMATVVFSVGADDPLEDVEAVMSSKKIRRVPVVDDENRLVGLISLNDLARYANEGKPSAAVDRKLVETLASICAPRARELIQREPPVAQVRA